MQLDLRGRTALVTGSTQGIGLAIATDLVRASARVGVNGRTEDRVDAAVDQLRADGDAFAAVGDVTTTESADALVAERPAIDVLVNNLGIFGAQPALDITDDDRRRYFEVNVLGAIRLIRAYLPGMRDRGWGRILNIAGDSAVVIPAEMIHYGMSKTALLAVSRGRREGGGRLRRADGGYVDSILP